MQRLRDELVCVVASCTSAFDHWALVAVESLGEPSFLRWLWLLLVVCG